MLTTEQRDQVLNAFRVDWGRRHDHANAPTGRAAGVGRPSTYTRAPARRYDPLIEVARARRWFKVDEQGAYR